MTMQVALIAAPVIGTGTEGDPNRPDMDTWTLTSAWSDVSGRLSAVYHDTPGLINIEVRADSTVMDDIDSDNAYFIIWVQDG